MDAWSLIALALGIAVCLEGLPYLIAPGASRRALLALAGIDDAALRLLGALAVLAGLALAWVALR